MPEGVPATIQSPWQAMASSGAAGSQPSECCSLTLYPTEFSMSSGAEHFRSGQSWQPEPQAGPSANMKPVPDVIWFVDSCASGKKCPSPSPWTRRIQSTHLSCMSMSCDSGISECHTDPLEQRWEWSVITKQVQRRRTPTPGTAAERSFKTGGLLVRTAQRGSLPDTEVS